MTVGDERAGTGPRLLQLDVADDPAAWAAAGFAVDGDDVRIGDVTLHLIGSDEQGRRGITGWTIAGATVTDGLLDGLPTSCRSDVATTGHHHAPTAHANGVNGLDHVVVLTPDLERTVAACEAASLDLRRIREGPGGNGVEVRQAFFRLETTILEVVSGPAGNADADPGTGPARWFGLAVDVDDLDATAAHLGDGLGPIKPAVQPGRRIATLRHKQFGLSTAIAAMDHRGDR